MYDRSVEVMEKYGLAVKNVVRGRGAILCETDLGWKILKEYWGSAGKIIMQQKIQKHCQEKGFLLTDRVLSNLEGEVITIVEDGTPYVVRDWIIGRECDTRAKEDLVKSVSAMAELHMVLDMEKEEKVPVYHLVEECKKHNRELRKTRKYLQKKKKKNPFEELMANHISMFLEEGENMVEKLEQSGYVEWMDGNHYRICHGDCNQHNIIFTKEGVGFVNFERWRYDCQVEDLCQFMRKILEKHGWDQELGNLLVASYEKKKHLSREELENLYLRLSYPWKFWKLVNFYANSNKVWISQKNMEKLQQTIDLFQPWKAYLSQFS